MSPAADTGLPVFSDVPPHRVHAASGFSVWFCDPLGIVTQFGESTHVDEDLAIFLTGKVTDELLGMRGASKCGLYFVHDWRRLKTYTRKARSMLTDWGLRLSGDIETVVLALGKESPSLVRMAASITATALSVAGADMRVVDDAADFIVKQGIKPRSV